MTDKRKDIDDLLSMFHDFEIIDIHLDNSTMTMKTLIPWGEKWDNENFKLKFKFKKCDYLKCTYDRRTSNELVRTDKHSYYPTTQILSENIEEIKKLQLYIQRHSFVEPNLYKLYCTSFEDGIEFAILDFTADDIDIFDENDQFVSLDQMKDWATKWWESIEQTWENQKKENNKTPDDGNNASNKS